METGTFAEYLSELDEASLTALLLRRPDVLVEPVPRGFAGLAQRLSGAASLAAALREVDRDAVVVGQAIAALDASATVPKVARLLGASEAAVQSAAAELVSRGLAWISSGTLFLPESLRAHWSESLGGRRPVAQIAKTVLADDLRVAVAALGGDVDGLRKPELIARLSELMADARAMAEVVAALPKSARRRLHEILRSRHGYFGHLRADNGPTALLVAYGLVLPLNGNPELPHEIAVAAWLAEREFLLTGRPEVPAAGADEAVIRTSAQAAAQEALLGITTLLDDAGSKPLVALKKGGIGARERTRLAGRLSIPESVLAVWIDVAHAAGLLGVTGSGYAPTPAYPAWRAAGPGMRWATVASAWLALEHAPSNREEIKGDKEVPPPLPVRSRAGMMRRALLSAARSGESMSAAGREIDWFCPLHGYEDGQRADKVAAALREAELLGVIAADTLTQLGEHLLAVPDAVEELASRCAPMLPEVACSVILQSDLTAVVAGEPSLALSRLLTAAAVSEARGAAGVWRFSPASVRAAFDAGWDSDELLGELRAISERELPQPLEYLITDVARRHGHVRVRGTRCCVVADEATITEILHTRSLRALRLGRLAPTVASSSAEPGDVLAGLRAAGLAPVAEDETGTVIVESRREHQASQVSSGSARARLTPVELVERLAADPVGEPVMSAATTDTLEVLAQYNRNLDDAELALLADALENGGDVRIVYRDKNGTRTIRDIQPENIYDRWLESWCYLRDAEREFTIANIESVSPAL
ncbi:helicase-associated domain-containing protein [Allokutzneria sp. A3M-2-11 16]|uniref:helicase-associated domain-containing protein n=1 Tax=Allokutzneria sp. A3M-2-11 16 TaxID=2962043 RepID=UPI0020B7C818|nr:helicase-associated domain-containing protein [Allokutzneria sp. A3M-2-11 16]MCP3799118.1 helicase-associated domain-containing protein [Allokutzneria sp. A3M-2-11 16]